MRVLMWMESHHPVIGGIQTGMRQFMPALRDQGHEVRLVTSHYGVSMPDVTVQDTISVHRFHFYEAIATNNAPLFIKERQRVSQFVGEFAPDVVHIMGFGFTGIFYLKTQQSHKTPFILTLRNDHSPELAAAHGDKLLRQLLSEADWITTASELEAGRIAAIMPEVTDKISCVYHGLVQPQVALMPPPAVPRLLCIGRHVVQKNFELAIQAFARIAPLFPDARLLFAGDGTDRPMLEQLVAELGLGEQVQFLGWVQPEEIPALINQATAVVLPSRWEGLPLTGIQTAQMARPLIATRVSGTPELVNDGETGLLVPSEDREALANAMATILSDLERARQMGEAAHRRIYDKFSLPRTVANYTALYERVTSPQAITER